MEFLTEIYESIEKNNYDKFIKLYPNYLENSSDWFVLWEPDYQLGEDYFFYPHCVCYGSYNDAYEQLHRVHKHRYELKCNCKYGKKYIMAMNAKQNPRLFKYIMDYDDTVVDLEHEFYYNYKN